MADIFSFKKFSINQEHCALKVGTDGVLLGAWAHGGNHILDIGCGTGLITLMMAQRFPSAIVEGVEIDKQAAGQAADNVKASPFAGRINIYLQDLQHFAPLSHYDSIVCNPPFFTNSLLPGEKARAMARHDYSLTLADIFLFAGKWLVREGELSVIFPKGQEQHCVSEASVKGFFLCRKYGVSTVTGKPEKRLLLSFSKQRPASFDRQSVCLCNPDGTRTDWYQTLTKDFYL